MCSALNNNKHYIFFRTDANPQNGTGHLMRCLALAQAWKKQSGKVIFISACSNEGFEERIIHEGFQFVSIEKPHPEPTDLETTLLSINCSYPNNTWVVLDGYHFNTNYQQSIKNEGRQLLVIDDIAHLDHYIADIILNQNINAKELAYSCGSETKLLLGTNYLLLRKEFSAYKNGNTELPEVAKKVLVTMGGGDPDNETLKVMKALNNVSKNNLEIKVVVGGCNPYIDSLKNTVEDIRHKVEFLQNVTNMSELMAWADIAVSAAGSTCWELAFMGVPAVLTITSHNQKGVAFGLERIGAVVNLGWKDNVSISKIAASVDCLINDYHTRDKMSRIGKTVIDGQGTNRVLSSLGIKI